VVLTFCINSVGSLRTGSEACGELLWFAVSFALRAFRVQWSKNGRRPRARGDGARPPAKEGVAEASPRGLEHADSDALRSQLLALIPAADAEAQEQIAPEKRPKGVLRRPRCVTFAPQLELEVEIEPDGDRRDQAEEALRARAEAGAEIGATLCDVTGRNGVDVSAALSRDDDCDECFVLLRGEDDVVLELKVRLLESSGSQRTEERLRASTLHGRSFPTTWRRTRVC